MTRAEAQDYIRNKIKTEIGDFHGCQTEAARRWGVVRQELSYALLTDKPFIGPTIRKAVGLKRVVTVTYEVTE